MTDIDFYVVENKDAKVLMIVDDSYWGHTETTNSYIGVILPGGNNFINFSFRKNTVNILNSINLGLNCEKNLERNDLPDGIYTIKVFSAMDKVERTKYCLRIDLLRRRLHSAVYKLGNYDNVSPNKIDMITEFLSLEVFAESALVSGDTERTQYLFNKMVNLVDKISCADC